MSYKKRDYIQLALEELRLADYVFDLEPQALESALRRLDAMMAEWDANGLHLSYPFPSSPGDSDLDQETNVPDIANEAIITNLALRLAPSYGKQITPETRRFASSAYNTLSRVYSAPGEMSFPSTLPKGAGNKTWREGQNPFVDPPGDRLTTGNNSYLTFN
jgi:hypothetical protein